MNNDIYFKLMDILRFNNNFDDRIRILLYFSDLRFKNRPIFVSNRVLADKLGISIDRVKRSLRWLKNARIIDIKVYEFNKRIIKLNFEDKKDVSLSIFDYNWLDDKDS